jgi:hypothetical protein
MPKAVRDALGLTEAERLETFCDGVFAIAIGPIGYGLSFALAFVSPWTSVALHVLLATLFALPERKPTPRQTTRSAAAT